MRRSLLPSDSALPTWLHTVLLLLIVSPFSGYLIWIGARAMATAHLEPVSGPELGQYFFGPAPILGRAARVAGLSLITLGCAFLAIAFRFSRLAEDHGIVRALPWGLVLASAALSVLARSLP